MQRIKLETSNGISILRTDNGKEFVNADIKKILACEGIEHQTSVPCAPEQNGKAEKEMRTITKAARTMLLAKQLPKNLWAEAVNAAVHVINRTGNSRIDGKSPYEIWFGKRAEIKYMKTFGIVCYVHIPKIHRKKWDAKARKGILVGYDGCSKGYRILFPSSNKVETHRDVTFALEKEIYQ